MITNHAGAIDGNESRALSMQRVLRRRLERRAVSAVQYKVRIIIQNPCPPYLFIVGSQIGTGKYTDRTTPAACHELPTSVADLSIRQGPNISRPPQQ
jgi:hypothetical protein